MKQLGVVQSPLLLKLLEKMTSLLSLKIKINHLALLIRDRETLIHLQHIEKLNITDSFEQIGNSSAFRRTESVNNSDMRRICRVFSNRKQLVCRLDNLITMRTALCELAKLEGMEVFAHDVDDSETEQDSMATYRSLKKQLAFVEVYSFL